MKLHKVFAFVLALCMMMSMASFASADGAIAAMAACRYLEQ